MRKFLLTTAAGLAIFSGGAYAIANAAPAANPALETLSLADNVALCFYVDGWNGPGMYDCGFRMNRGHGWHGKRHDDKHVERHDDHNDHHDGKDDKH